MFHNKTILITGGTGTFGEKFIYKLLSENKSLPKKLILLGRNKNSLLNIQRTVISNGIACEILFCDLLNFDPDTIFRKEKIDILLQCAGYLKQQSFLHGNLSEIEKENQLNYLIPINFIHKFLYNYDFTKENLARVINVLSLAGTVPSPTMLGYSASKSALKHFTDGLRLELNKIPHGNNIHIHNITLSLFESNMTENISKYKFIAPSCPDMIVNSVYTELMNGRKDIAIGLQTKSAMLINGLAPGIMKMIAGSTSPGISHDGKIT